MSDKIQAEYPVENWVKFPKVILDNLNVFDVDEIMIFLYLMNQDDLLRAGDIAEHCKLKSISTRILLDNLIEKGLVTNCGNGVTGLYSTTWGKAE